MTYEINFGSDDGPHADLILDFDIRVMVGDRLDLEPTEGFYKARTGQFKVVRRTILPASDAKGGRSETRISLLVKEASDTQP